MSDEDAEGTITSHLKKPVDMIEFLGIPEVPNYMRELMEILEQDSIRLIGIDFAQGFSQTSAMIIKHMPNGDMEVEMIDPRDFGIQGQKPDLIILDDPIAEVDYSALEMRVLGEGLNPLVSSSRGHGKTNMMLQFYGLKDTPEPVGYKDIPRKPLKKNGKDASYLDLDPTKKHRRKW